MSEIANGLIVTVDNGCGERKRYVWQRNIGSDDRRDLEGLRDLLWQLVEDYGPATSRYSEHRLVVRVEPGGRYDDHKLSEDG
jgi:hypothetical protein